eukprot:9932074-Alexandrium_andersonii.AAC.1
MDGGTVEKWKHMVGGRHQWGAILQRRGRGDWTWKRRLTRTPEPEWKCHSEGGWGDEGRSCDEGERNESCETVGCA